MSTMSESYLALQVLMMPKDTNGLVAPSLPGTLPNVLYMTIFGGVILSYIDQAGALGARHEVLRAGGPLPFVVTVAFNRVEFKQPVLVGDLVRFTTSLVRMGRSSVTVHVNGEAERREQSLQVTEAEVVYVAIDPTARERHGVPLRPGKRS